MSFTALLQTLPLFEGMPEDLLLPLSDAARVLHLASGDPLYREGDLPDDFHFLLHGRLQVIARGSVLGHVNRGEPVGEMSVVSHEPRKATVRALRDATVLAIRAPQLMTFLAGHPDALMRLTRLIVSRARKSARSDQQLKQRTGTLAVIPALPGLPVLTVAEALVSHMSRWPAARLVTATHVEALFGPGSAQTPLDGGEADLRLRHWLVQLEQRHRHVLFAAAGVDDPWTLRCLRQADRILVLADAGRQPEEVTVLKALQGEGRVAPVELVLQRPEGDDSPHTLAWCHATGARAHYFLHPGSATDLAAIARQISGRGIGLVLGGGGARGFAHIGLVRALEQLQIPVDVVGGTSMGAFVGALLACDFDSVEMAHIARETFVARNYLNDYTLPKVSLIRGERFHGRLQAIFGERRIEELRRTFYCISTNLTTGQPVVHDRGGLATWVGSSMSVPGVAPPVAWEGDLLCDGAVVNNLPTDVMHGLERGVIMASNVSSEEDVRAPGAGIGEPDQRALLNWKGSNKPPGLSEILMRSATLTSETITQAASIERADIYLRMPIDDIGMFDWLRLDALVERGYEHALSVLEHHPQLGRR